MSLLEYPKLKVNVCLCFQSCLLTVMISLVEKVMCFSTPVWSGHLWSALRQNGRIYVFGTGVFRINKNITV